MIPNILLQIVSVPVLTSLFIYLIRRRKIARKSGWIAGLAHLYTTLLLCLVGLRVYRGEVVYEWYRVGPKVNFALLADGLSLPIALVINLCVTALAFYSIRYIEHRIEEIYKGADEETEIMYYTRFFLLFPFFTTGFMGVIFSTNLIALYFFMEIMAPIPLYFIVAQFGYSDFMDRYRVAMLSLPWTLGPAFLFLVGIFLAYIQTGNFEIQGLCALLENPLAKWVILFMLLGLLPKLAMFPFHVWMPLVHAEHPTCIAGLLPVYANIPAYVIARVLILPLYEEFKVFSFPLMIIALVTIIYGSLLTLAQNDVKRFAACSTISQISYSILGLSTLNVWGVEGGLFFFLSHIMGKTILFSTAGILVYVTGTRDIRKMGGLAAKMPLTALLWTIGAMMLSAFPPFSTFVAEWLMFTGVFISGVYSSLPKLIVAILAISAVGLTVIYTFWALKRIFFGPLNPNLLSNHKIKDPPLTMSVPLLTLAAVATFLGLYPKPIMDLFHLVVRLP